MRTLFVLFVLSLVSLCTLPAEACEQCYQYYSYQTDDWCDFCDVAPCGYFNCSIRYYEGLGTDYCSGDDGGCFTNGGMSEGTPNSTQSAEAS